MKFLRADTQVIVPVGPAVSISDGFTMVDTSLDISTADAASLIKRNNATAVDISGNTWAAYATPAVHGMYKLTLTAGNLDTEGELTVVIEDVSLALPIREDFMVVNANVYDALFAAATTDYLQVDAFQLAGGAIPTPNTTGVPDVNVTEMNDSAADAVSLAALGAGLVLTSAVIETVTSQTQLVIPATADAVQNDAYNGCIAVLIDADDANNKSFSLITDYVASTRTVTLANAPTFTVTTADTITILAGATASSVWDRVLDGNTHNIANSAGKRLRTVDAAFVVHQGTADGSGGGNNTIDLETGAASTTDNIYNGDRIIIVGGTGVGEHGIVVAYDGTTNQRCTMSQDWVIQPDSTSEYEIVPADVDVESWANTTVPVPNTAGVPDVNVQEWKDETVPAPAATGVPDVNVTHLNDSATAAAKLALGARTTITGTVDAGASNTACAITYTNVDTSPAANDTLIGRTIIFLDATSNAAEATDITDYVLSTRTVTYTALAGGTAPNSGSIAVIL
jgi:hypothetical protein